jgi:hypothetical protein
VGRVKAVEVVSIGIGKVRPWGMSGIRCGMSMVVARRLLRLLAPMAGAIRFDSAESAW